MFINSIFRTLSSVLSNNPLTEIHENGLRGPTALQTL